MRTAIVTGSTRGIGRAIAAAILGNGGRVMVTGRDAGRVVSTVDELGRAASPDRVAGMALDVRDREAVERLMTKTAEAFGGFDTLINNAGIGLSADVASTTDAGWDNVIGTNLTGPFYCSRAAVPFLIRSGGGWIINIASLAGAHPFAGGAAYCASKAGLIAFTEALMQEVRAQGIRVGVVLPGSVATEFSGRAKEDDAAWRLSPEDVAEAVVGLLRHPSRSLPSRVEIRPAKTKPT